MARASKINQLEKLERMYSKGQISYQEYARLKAELMGDNEHRPVNVIRVETATIRRDTPQKSGCLGLVVKAIILLVVAVGVFLYLVNKSDDSTNGKASSAPATTQPKKTPATPNTEHKPSANEEHDDIDSLF